MNDDEARAWVARELFDLVAISSPSQAEHEAVDHLENRCAVWDLPVTRMPVDGAADDLLIGWSARPSLHDDPDRRSTERPRGQASAGARRIGLVRGRRLWASRVDPDHLAAWVGVTRCSTLPAPRPCRRAEVEVGGFIDDAHGALEHDDGLSGRENDGGGGTARVAVVGPPQAHLGHVALVEEHVGRPAHSSSGSHSSVSIRGR